MAEREQESEHGDRKETAARMPAAPEDADERQREPGVGEELGHGPALRHDVEGELPEEPVHRHADEAEAREPVRGVVRDDPGAPQV